MYLARNREKVGKSHSNIPFFKNLSTSVCILQEAQRRFANKPSDQRIRRWRCRGPPPPVPKAWTQCVFRHHSVSITLYLFSRVRLHCVLQCALIHLSVILCFPLLTSSPQLQATCCLSFFPCLILLSSSLIFVLQALSSLQPFTLFISFSPLLFPYLGHMEPTVWKPRSCSAVFVQVLFSSFPVLGLLILCLLFSCVCLIFGLFKQNKEVKMRKQSTLPVDFTQCAGTALQC